MIIALNLKAYEETSARLKELCIATKEAAAEYGKTRFILCVPSICLKDALARYPDVYAQGADPVAPGARTGKITPEMLKFAGAKGSLINHSENRMQKGGIKFLVEKFRELGLESMVCAQDTEESVELSKLEPDFVAIEPPELIGSGRSVTSVNPKVVSETVEAIAAVSKCRVLCGAGISTPEDVATAKELGAKGVLLASAFVKSKEPLEFLREFAEAGEQ
jgi:triosephosphate isomerase